MLSATAIVLAFWLAVVWYFDIDGFQERRRIKPADSMETPRAPSVRAGGRTESCHRPSKV